MQTYHSFEEIEQTLESRPDNTVASDESLKWGESVDAELEHAAQHADLEVAYKIKLKRLSAECRALSNDLGKGHPSVKSAWRHFFQIRDGLVATGHLGQTTLSPAAAAKMRQRDIHRCSSINLAMKIAQDVAKRHANLEIEDETIKGKRYRYTNCIYAGKASIYHHPEHHEYWVFPMDLEPKDTSGLICTMWWNGKTLKVDEFQEPSAFVDQLQHAQRIPFSVTFCKDAHDAATYGEITIRAYTQEGCAAIFAERFPNYHLIDTQHADAIQEDPQAALDEFTFDDRESVGGYIAEAV